MFWARGKGYLSQEKFNLWEEVYTTNRLDAIDFNDFLYNEHGEYGAKFAVVISEDWNQEDQDKAFMIFAEFVSESIVYQKRLKDFLEEYYE